MPAVRAFSLYAATAIFCNFLLQITCFLALFTIDVRREEVNSSHFADHKYQYIYRIFDPKYVVVERKAMRKCTKRKMMVAWFDYLRISIRPSCCRQYMFE
jgi:hypothetical protein